MSKLVTVMMLDEATRIPTGKTEEVMMNDAIENLRNQNVFTTDDEGIFFQRQLEYIQAQSYDVLYPDLKGRTTFALNTEGGEGINQITYRSYDKRGEAAIIAGKATDLPRADIDGKEYTIDVRTIGNAYGYSRQELAAARLTGMPLDARKAEAARRAYEEKVNQIIWFGDVKHNLGGLFDGPTGFPQETIPNIAVAAASGGTNSLVWGVDKTPDEVIADLTGALATMFDDTKMIHRPNKILMGVTKYNYMMNTPRSLQSDMSILTWFLQNNDFITDRSQIVVVNELKGVFGADPGFETGDAEGFVILQEGMDVMRLREPFPYVHLPVQYKGLEFEINCYGRFAGLEIIRPQAISFYYGI
jgi:hypothetical protein